MSYNGVLVLHDNILTEGALVATPTTSGYTVKNLLSRRDYLWWKGSSNSCVINLTATAVTETADYLFISSHNLDGATIQLVSGPNSGSTTVRASTVVSGNGPILLTFTETSAKFWELQITSVSNPTLSMILLGKTMVLPGMIGEAFDPIGRKFSGQKNVNENGQPLGTAYLHEVWDEKITVHDIPQDWLRTIWLPAWRSSIRDKPFALAWNPDLYPDEYQTVIVKDGFETKHHTGLTSDLTFSVIGLYQ